MWDIRSKIILFTILPQIDTIYKLNSKSMPAITAVIYSPVNSRDNIETPSNPRENKYEH